ncbi:peptidoglycan-binding protein [Sporolactobacillus terrae]|nr:peptidoglycan-binding protein [Sporolactobacillus terrae]
MGGTPMYTGITLAKTAAVAATFTSSFIILPQNAAAHLNNDALLYEGMHSGEIKTIQSILKASGDYPLKKTTGYFGSKTEKAVKSFQKNSKIAIDGIVGSETKGALIKYINQHMDLLEHGSKGNEVAYLQEMLREIGFSNLPVDGYFGARTEAAVRTLQHEMKISRDGVVGPKTWKKIESLLKNSRKIDTAVPATSAAQNNPKKAAEQSRVQAAPLKKDTVRKTENVSIVREFYANSTAYTANCNGCSGTTATGINLHQNPNSKVIAVDPSVIPLGTKLFVEGYGYAIAGDTGGAIKGHRIDVFFKDNNRALQWGRRTVKVKILE